MSKKSQKNFSYNKRYKHKLNMLGPGQIMMKISLIMFGLGVLFYILKIKMIYVLLWSLAGILFLLLLILASIELHQDHVLYELAKIQDPKIK